MFIRQDYFGKVAPYAGLDVVKVLTGMRRSGKSVLLDQIRSWLASKRDGALEVCVNFEEEENARFLKKGALGKLVGEALRRADGRGVRVFLDEPHEAEEWEKAVNSMRAKPGVDVYLTGSNSKMLSGELATHLTGRVVEIPVTPFAFREFAAAGRNAFRGMAREAVFLKYLEVGGMPFLSNLGWRPDLAKGYLEDVFSAILLKDVARRGNVRDIDLLERIARYVMAEAGHPFSASSIARYLKGEGRPCTVDTVLNYLSLCEDAFLFARVRREDLAGKRILAVDEKFYAEDHGMRRAVVGGDARHDIDQALENIVCTELRRRGWNVTVGRAREREIDFVGERNGERAYWQVAYLMPTEETRAREFDAFDRVPDHYPRFVVSMDPVNLSRNGIRHLNICDFLEEEFHA